MSTTTSTESPLLGLPDAVAGNGIDAPVAAHYGSFIGEQRTLEAGDGFVDLSHRGVVRVSGPDRLTWLHSLTTQFFEGLAPRTPIGALVLDPQGHVEHAMFGVDDGEAFTAHVEPGQAPALVAWLDRMRFMMRVEVSDVTEQFAVAWRPSARMEAAPYSGYELIPRAELATYAAAAGPACGMWAFEALRIARGEPRLGLDTDARTIPNEAGWIGPAVHLSKGCYRGQETVARVHTLGKPPRRLTMLHLDGSDNRLPALGQRPGPGREGGRLRRHQRPPPRARPDRAGDGQAQRPPGRHAGRRRAGGRPGGRRRPRGGAARAAHPALSAAQAFSRSATLSLGGSTKR